MPRATRHIDADGRRSSRRCSSGDHAYRTDDGSIFFRISSWPAYGRLARLDPDGLRVGERVEADEYGKDDVRDFALWKGPKPGEPVWETAIGPGRPGWHIECSAMSMAHLGPSFDIHTGGIDLIFPHHEDEIAQSEAATGQTFVGTWLHCAHLQMGGSKMAKSTGNIARVGDYLAAGVSPRALRLALISVHYRAALNSVGRLAGRGGRRPRAARCGRRRARRLPRGRPGRPELVEALAAARDAFGEALDDDLNVSAAPGGAVRPGPRPEPADRAAVALDRRRRPGAGSCSATWTACWRSCPTRRDDLEPAAAALLDERAAARAARDFAASDRLRDELAELGVTVEDTRDGQRWRRTVEAGRG